MKRQRLLVVIGVVILLVAGSGGVWFLALRPPRPVTLEQVQAVQPGMSRAEVDGLLNSPSEDYVGDGIRYPIFQIEDGEKGRMWTTTEGHAVVFFDPEDRVVQVLQFTYAPRPPWYVRLGQMLGL